MIGKDTKRLVVYIYKKDKELFKKKAEKNRQNMSERLAELISKDIAK